MKPIFWHVLPIVVAGSLSAGCSFKRVTDSPRHFVLEPIPAEELAPPATRNLAVGICFVRMPPELLRDSIAVQISSDEFGYLENALWAERFDHCFERALAANLSHLLSSDSIYAGNWSGDEVVLRVSIDIEKFEVDTNGQGTLLARWRIKRRGSDQAAKTGRAQVIRAGASARVKPDAIVRTLSELTADFSRELAQAIDNTAQELARGGSFEEW